MRIGSLVRDVDDRSVSTGRKVRAPEGRVVPNGNALLVREVTESGTEIQTADGPGFGPGSGKGEKVR